jgi:hypothetical protein
MTSSKDSVKHTTSFWVRFHTGNSGTVHATSQAEALKLAKEITGRDPTRADMLPYPAEPQLNKSSHGCPPFCYKPIECIGRSCCPQNYACSE